MVIISCLHTTIIQCFGPIKNIILSLNPHSPYSCQDRKRPWAAMFVAEINAVVDCLCVFVTGHTILSMPIAGATTEEINMLMCRKLVSKCPCCFVPCFCV